MTRRQLTDEQWTLIEPFLPIGEYGPYPGRLRDQFEGVIWRFRTGAQWREMPDEFGRWPTVYGRFRKERNAVERLINRLKDWRGIATRFDKTPESYLAGLELRASMIWLEDLLQAAN